MVGVPRFYTTAEHEEFAEKPHKGRFLSSQSSYLADFDVRHAFWRFNAIIFRLLEENSTAVDPICSYLWAYLWATATSCSFLMGCDSQAADFINKALGVVSLVGPNRPARPAHRRQHGGDRGAAAQPLDRRLAPLSPEPED